MPGGQRLSGTPESVAQGRITVRMDGKETFKNAVNAMVSAANEAMRRCEIDITKIKCVIPHQANQRIISAVGERLGTTESSFRQTFTSTANTPPPRWRLP